MYNASLLRSLYLNRMLSNRRVHGVFARGRKRGRAQVRVRTSEGGEGGGRERETGYPPPAVGFCCSKCQSTASMAYATLGWRFGEVPPKHIGR